MPEHADICKRFGARIRSLRKRQGWTQDELAAVSGIGRDYLSKIENGRREPCLRVQQALAGSFKMSLAKLMRSV